jgi:hypothetical protein
MVLPPGEVTLPFTATVSIPVAHPSASTNFGEQPEKRQSAGLASKEPKSLFDPDPVFAFSPQTPCFLSVAEGIRISGIRRAKAARRVYQRSRTFEKPLI